MPSANSSTVFSFFVKAARMFHENVLVWIGLRVTSISIPWFVIWPKLVLYKPNPEDEGIEMLPIRLVVVFLYQVKSISIFLLQKLRLVPSSISFENSGVRLGSYAVL